MATSITCLFCLALAPFLGGCIIIPLPHAERSVPDSRQVITTQQSQFIRPGSTMREDVLLQLGEPRWRMRQDQLIAYEWTTSSVRVFVVIFVGPLPGAGGEKEL